MYRLGIDLGGTNIVAGVVDENFKIIATAKRKTNCPRPAEEIVKDMAEVSLEAIAKAGLEAKDIVSAGVGSPGSINPTEGIVVYSNNLGFFNLELSKLLKEKTGIDFYLDNDANAAAYGELIAGAGKGVNNFVMLTLGTGVGGGVIIDGRMLTGSNYAGAELGHTVIDINGQMCSCGRQGCFEAYASATALIRQTKQAMVKYPNSIMWDIVKGDINAVNGLTAFDAMRKGDEAGKAVVDKYIYYLSVGVANMINIFQPEILCIGGGVSKEGDNIIVPLQKIVDGENYARLMEKKAVIKAAELGNDAGIIGAAYLGDLYK
ncbi:MAG: ROK family protein [Clostridia bacterium]|nr:ROK family protein [Clostridia bacterium]